MPDDRSDRAGRSGQTQDPPPYTVYRSGVTRRNAPDSPEADERPYKLYRSAPRGLMARLRNEDAPAERPSAAERRAAAGGDGGGYDVPAHERDDRPWWRRRWTPMRVLRWVVGICVFWLLLSLALFLVSATVESGGSIPDSAKRQLSSGSNMLTGTDTVLVLGLDQRPAGSKEPGAFAGGVRTDSIMLWRIGGGISRRLSIPRDTWVPIPGHGSAKINAAYAYGGPALTIRTVQQLTHVKINHVVIVNLENFPKFIDAIGGVSVRTGHICSEISGGARNGGWTLNLRPGTHHLNGTQALVLARTRENSCNAASNDLTREAYQQKILNAIKARLVSPGIVPRLPWAAWNAPTALRTDMGGFTLMQLFVAAEWGGSAPTDILKPSASAVIDGQDALIASPADVRRHVHKLLNGH